MENHLEIGQKSYRVTTRTFKVELDSDPCMLIYIHIFSY